MRHTATGVMNGNFRGGMYYEREQAIKAEIAAASLTLTPDEVEAANAKELIRSIKGDAFLQEWIRDNFGLPGPRYCRALIALAQTLKSTAMVVDVPDQ